MGAKKKIGCEAMVYTECMLKQLENLDVAVEDANVLSELGFKGLKAWRAKMLVKKFAKIARKTANAIYKLRESVEPDDTK